MTAYRFNSAESNVLETKANRMFQRLFQLNPLPEEVKGYNSLTYHRSCFPEDVQTTLTQMEHLTAKYKGAKDTYRNASPTINFGNSSYTSQVYFDMPLDGGCIPNPEDYGDYRVRLSFDFYKLRRLEGKSRDIFEPNNSIPLVDRDSPAYPVLSKWIEGEIRTKRLVDNANKLFRTLTCYCKTPGQWKRVFPEFIVLLEREQQEILRSQIRSSPVPRGIHKEHIARLPALAILLAKSAILPEHNHNETTLIQVDSHTKIKRNV